MRVAIFADTFSPEINGVTNTLNRLLSYLDERRISYLIFAPDYETEAKEESKIIYFRGIIPFLSPNSRIALPSQAVVKKKVEEFRPDIIHVVTEFTIGYVGMKVARACKIPLIMSYHTNLDQYVQHYKMTYMKKPVGAYLRYFHNHARLNLCPSIHTMVTLEKQGYKKLALWSRGVDTTLFSPRKHCIDFKEQIGFENRFLFLYAGRIAVEKSLDILMKSIYYINRIYGDKVGFVFMGDGPYLEELKECNIDNVFFTGFLQGEELAKVYASCDCFTFPSGTETFGNVVLEAMASGLPVICADAGGVTDFTCHKKNAYVTMYQNSVSLFYAMREVYENTVLRQQLINGSLVTAGKKSWNKIFDRLLISYEEVIHSTNEALSSILD